jgi:hypothetical protein
MARLHEIWAHLKLVADVKDLANKMKHMRSIRIILVLHHLAHQGSQNCKAVLYDGVERLSVFVQLKFESGSQSKEPLQTSVNAFSSSWTISCVLEALKNLILEVWQFLWIIMDADHLQ